MRKTKDLAAHSLETVPHLLIRFMKKNMSQTSMFSPTKVTQPENLLPSIPWVHVTLIAKVNENPSYFTAQKLHLETHVYLEWCNHS